MQIVSYRGPGMAGGVSPALTRLVADDSAHHTWWHIESDTIKYSNAAGKVVTKQPIPKAVIEGHYRYCNEFIWPIMHDLHEYATYRAEDRALYERFNRIMAREIAGNRSALFNDQSKLFVQDYQLALLPKELQRLDGPRSGVFWHIPWPKSVPTEFLPALIDMAKSILSSEFIGFHTQEYCANFFRFVAKHIDGVTVSIRDRMIVREHRPHTVNPQHSLFSVPSSSDRMAIRNQSTMVIAAPLGLDVDHWQDLAREQTKTLVHPALINTDFVLSVDRADYTKGVVPRMEAIHHFFNDHPEMIGKITFAQLCTQTRPGLEAFDRYWNDFQKLSREVNNRYKREDWQPIVNLKGPLNGNDLSLLYSHASVMMVNPLRDGLNLTAKEYVACQTNKPGALLLSAHAGAYEELGQWTTKVDPFDTRGMGNAVFEALNLSQTEKSSRMKNMFAVLKANTISSWCDQFKFLLEPEMEREEAAVNG